MLNKFDIYGRLEIPPLILCEISKEKICKLYLSGNPEFDLNFISISKVSFTIPEIVNGKKYLYYDEVKELRMIYVPDYGYFQIRDIDEVSDGIKSYKSCVAYSAESMLSGKRVTNIKGEYKLWNPINNDETLMGILLNMIPGWEIGTVDGIVATRQRTVDITESDLYNIFTNEFYQIFEAIFVFDYNNFKINIYDANKIFKDTGIILSFENLLKEVSITPQTDEIITALKVIGGDGLDISGVNPTGDTIYNVSYFKDRMSDALQNQLNNYEVKYNSLIGKFSDLLIGYKNKNTELAYLHSNAPEYNVNFQVNQDGTAKIIPSLSNESGLDQLNALIDTLNGVKSVRIAQGNIPYSDVNSILSSVQSMISAKESSINRIEKELEIIMTQILDIKEQLKMENNFSEAEWIELNGYFIYGTVQENGYTIYDNMTQEEKQQIRMDLLDYGKLVLEKSCVPKYLFKISSVNFLALSDFKKFQDEFELGTTFTLKTKENQIVKPLLLGVHLNFNDLSDFTLIYGNKTKVNEGFDFSPFSNAISVSSNISFDLIKLEAMKKQANDVTKFLNNSLITAVNDIKSNEILTKYEMNEHGIRLYTYDYNTNEQLGFESWWTGSILAFSDDNFTSAKLALGRIKAPNGGYVYGLNAEVIAGNIMISNELHIQNDSNTFKVDASGATLVNASLTVSKGQNTIKIDPSNGFTIYKGSISDSNRQIYLGTDGNVYFRGAVNINNKAVIDANGNASFAYVDIYGGIIRLGGTEITPSSFYTNCGLLEHSLMDETCLYLGEINGNQIRANSITANQIAANTITANQISAGAITSSKIAAGAITAVNIASKAITADKIDVDSLYVTRIYGSKAGANSGYLRVIYGGSSSGLELIGSGYNRSVFKVEQYGGDGYVDFYAQNSRFMTVEKTGGVAVSCSGYWTFENIIVNGSIQGNGLSAKFE